MGVPGFFAWILKNCNDFNIIKQILLDIDILYLDTNCLLHPQCLYVLEKFKSYNCCDDQCKMENDMIDAICTYILKIIDVVKPRCKIFVAIDGVAPMAKINQQRKRRYKSIYDEELKNNIMKKHDIKCNDIKWSNVSISPGTEFMEKIHQRLCVFLDNLSRESKIPITYSSYHTHGEGEHKILQDIKENIINDRNKRLVVYGLDADLIFLTLTCNRTDLFLLREESYLTKKNTNEISGNEQNFCFVSIDMFRTAINYIIRDLIDANKNNATSENSANDDNDIDDNNDYEYDFVFDFVLICFMMGNDFLPNIPSIDIGNKGLEYLLSCYVKIFIEFGYGIVTDDLQINNKQFVNFIKKLHEGEDYYFKYIFPNKIYLKQHTKKKFENEYEKDLYELENLVCDLNIYDPVRLGVGNIYDYKFRYYSHNFNSSYNQIKLINTICYEYLKGIKWVFNYYFLKCSDWTWQYPFLHGPFLSDIYSYTSNNNININNYIFDLHSPLVPFEQLLLIIPPQYVTLLPEAYHKYMLSTNSLIADYFPIKIEIDFIGKDKLWKGIPLLPVIELDRIRKVITDDLRYDQCNLYLNDIIY